MASVRQASKLTRLKTAAEVLLSPLDYPGLQQWMAAVVRVMECAFQAEWSLFVLPSQEQQLLCTEGTCSDSFEVNHAIVAKGEPQAGKSEILGLPQWPEQGGGFGARVQCLGELDALSEGAVCTCIQQARTNIPEGLARFVRLQTPSRAGSAELVWGQSDTDDRRFGKAGDMEAAELLLPAFRAGTLLALQPACGEKQVLKAFDRLGMSALLLDGRGRVLERTPRMEALLEMEPERGELLGAAALLARRLMSLRCPKKSSPTPPEQLCACAGVPTSTARYRLRGAFLPASAGLPGSKVMVSFQQDKDLVIPTASELVTARGLTPRQAEVALLLARGASDQEVADTLAISPHTARKHAEHIFAKLGVHSRKAIALQLMGPVSAG